MSKLRVSKTCSRCRSFCFFAATCLVASQTMTGQNLSPTRLSRCRPTPQLRSTSARGSRRGSIGSRKQTRFSIKRSRPDIQGKSLISKGRRCSRRRANIARPWSCARDWRRTILGFTRLGRSRLCWRKWRNGTAAETLLCGRARCGRWRIALALRPTALRMGRERDAPRRSAPCGGDSSLELDASCRSMFRDVAIAPRWLSPAGNWMSLLRSSRRCSKSPTIRNIAGLMRRSWPREVTAKLRAKRNVQPQRMSCCWRDGPKPMPTMLRPSSWASAIDRSVLSSLASANWKLRDTPRSRRLLAEALRNAQQVSAVQEDAA